MGAIRAQLGVRHLGEGEPNGAAANATPIPNNTVVRAPITPNGDVDLYSFQAAAGDRVFAATMTAGSSTTNSDSTLELIGSDGTTVIEQDLDDGEHGVNASSIAGASIPANGTYFLRVTSSSSAQQLRPYDLHLRVQSTAPVAEAEPNDMIGMAQVLPTSGFVAGNASTATDDDFYELELEAGDTIYASLDLDPERDGEWNGSIVLLMPNDSLVTIDDSGGDAGPDSEALFETVTEAGTTG